MNNDEKRIFLRFLSKQRNTAKKGSNCFICDVFMSGLAMGTFEQFFVPLELYSGSSNSTCG